jgi:hypothetical protein
VRSSDKEPVRAKKPSRCRDHPRVGWPSNEILKFLQIALSRRMMREFLQSRVSKLRSFMQRPNKIRGLHENDFVLATKIDRIFARARGMNEFYLSCNLHRFLVPSAFFDRSRDAITHLAASRHKIATDV